MFEFQLQSHRCDCPYWECRRWPLLRFCKVLFSLIHHILVIVANEYLCNLLFICAKKRDFNFVFTGTVAAQRTNGIRSTTPR